MTQLNFHDTIFSHHYLGLPCSSASDRTKTANLLIRPLAVSLAQKAAVKSAASAASLDGFGSHEQVSCKRSLAEDQKPLLMISKSI